MPVVVAHQELGVRQVVQDVVDGVVPGAHVRHVGSAIAALVDSAAPLPDDAVAVGRETQPVVILGAGPEDGQGRLDVQVVDVSARRAVAHHGHVVARRPRRAALTLWPATSRLLANGREEVPQRPGPAGERRRSEDGVRVLAVWLVAETEMAIDCCCSCRTASTFLMFFALRRPRRRSTGEI